MSKKCELCGCNTKKSKFIMHVTKNRDICGNCAIALGKVFFAPKQSLTA